MFKRKPIRDYQAELPWKYPDRPVLKAWHRWAIPYNLLHIQIAYAVAALASFGIGFINYKGSLIDNKGWFQLEPILSSIVMFLLFMSLFYMIFFEKKIYVYRCTTEGLEVCSWKEGYKKAIFAMKLAAVLGAIALIFTAVHINQPGIFLLAFVGPGGIALMSLSMMGSKDYIKYQRDFDHDEFKWRDTEEQLLIDKNRKIISIYGTTYEEQYNLTLVGSYPIFCDKERFEEILAFIKEKYPTLPCKEQRAKIDDTVSYSGKPQTTLFTYIKNPTKTEQ